MISALDEAVMNVTLALRRVNKYRDTVMVFMSDNGGAEKGSNWPLRGGKNSVWEGGTKSVAFVHYPRYLLLISNYCDARLGLIFIRSDTSGHASL